MKIILIRIGGILPIKKKAQTEVDWNDNELEQLISAIKPSTSAPGKIRDGIDYHIEYNNGTFPVDWEKIPAKYKKTFETLKDNLVVEKQ